MFYVMTRKYRFMSVRGATHILAPLILLTLITLTWSLSGCKTSHTQEFPIDTPNTMTVSMSEKTVDYPQGHIAIKMLSGYALQSVNSLVRRAPEPLTGASLEAALQADRMVLNYKEPCKISLHEKEAPADAVKDSDGFTVAEGVSSILIPLDGERAGQILIIDSTGKNSMALIPSISVSRQSLADTLIDIK